MTATPTTVSSVIRRIHAFRRHKDWTISRLAREAGIGKSTVRGMDTPAWNPTRQILERLEAIIPTDFTITPSEAA